MSQYDPAAFAHDWIAAWNSHDLEAILSHYDPTVTLVSPAAAKLLADPNGTIHGIDALRAYFQRGLEAFPNLRFTLIETLAGLSSIVLFYENQRGTHTAEYMELNPEGRVTRVVANYSL